MPHRVSLTRSKMYAGTAMPPWSAEVTSEIQTLYVPGFRASSDRILCRGVRSIVSFKSKHKTRPVPDRCKLDLGALNLTSGRERRILSATLSGKLVNRNENRSLRYSSSLSVLISIICPPPLYSHLQAGPALRTKNCRMVPFRELPFLLLQNLQSGEDRYQPVSQRF